MKDKVWSRPKLVVLVRNKPEEAVLWLCKADTGGTGPGTTNTMCYLAEDPPCDPTMCYGTVAT